MVGRAELRSLLADPHAPSPAQAAQLGSRAALSPMRARPGLRGLSGHAQVRSLWPLCMRASEAPALPTLSLPLVMENFAGN